MIDTILTIAAAAAEHGESSGGLVRLFGQFGLEKELIIGQALNFALVAFILYKFAFKPVLATMEDRQQKISDGLQFAEEMKSKLADAEKKHGEILRKAQREAQDILEESRSDAQAMYTRETEEAARKVEEMLNKGRDANELARKKMLSEVRQEVARLVVLTTGKVLEKHLTDEDKRELNESAARRIASVGEEN